VFVPHGPSSVFFGASGLSNLHVIQQMEKRQSTSDPVEILSNIKCRRYFAFISVEELSYSHANHHATK
jgi:hypothetical protein